MAINVEKFQKLLIGTSGIYAIYFIGSIIQQRIMKFPYKNPVTGEMQMFENSNAFILVPSIISWVIGFFYNKTKEKPKQVIPEIKWFQSSALILLGALAMTEAIYETNFPLVTLFKSCNLLSVLVVGVFFSRVNDKLQKLGKQKIIIGIIVTFGVLMYHFGNYKQSADFTGEKFGICLLIFSLVCDGLLPDFQAQIKSKYNPSPMHMFENTNRWKTYLSAIYSLRSFQIKYIVVFFYEKPECFMHMMILGITGAIGQMFVYWTISHFRQHVVPFIITTRKIFTVVISIVYFHHQISSIQIVGIVIVLITVFYDFKQQINLIQVVAQKKVQVKLQCKQQCNALLSQQINSQQNSNHQTYTKQVDKQVQLHKTSLKPLI